MKRKTLAKAQKLDNKINSLKHTLEEDNFTISTTGLPDYQITKRLSYAIEREEAKARNKIIKLIEADLVLLNQEFEEL